MHFTLCFVQKCLPWGGSTCGSAAAGLDLPCCGLGDVLSLRPGSSSSSAAKKLLRAFLLRSSLRSSGSAPALSYLLYSVFCFCRFWLSVALVVLLILLSLSGVINIRQPPARKAIRDAGSQKPKPHQQRRRDEAGLTIEKCGVRPDPRC